MTPLVAASDGPPSPDPFGDEDVPWPGPECLRGEIAVGFSRLVYEGGSVDDLVTCGEGRDVAALYVLDDGVWITCILGAPEFVNRPFRELYPDRLPPATPLVARSEGPSGTGTHGVDGGN